MKERCCDERDQDRINGQVQARIRKEQSKVTGRARTVEQASSHGSATARDRCYGLYRFRPWARLAGIVLAIVSLTVIPSGTILGIYGLWVHRSPFRSMS